MEKWVLLSRRLWGAIFGVIAAAGLLTPGLADHINATVMGAFALVGSILGIISTAKSVGEPVGGQDSLTLAPPGK